jgi:hypothetical protein
MLKQLDPTTLLAKFEDIVKAGTKVVDSNISSSQLGSFVDLAMKAKGQETRRLTIGPPDFDASFSTVPDFDQIHQKVDALLAPAPAAGAAEDGTSQQYPAPGPLSAAGALPDAQPGTQPAPPPSDFTPVTTTPDGEPITEEMLNQFKLNGDEQSIRNLVATNGQCAPL